MTDDTVPISEMGIGNEDVEDSLEEVAETLIDNWGDWLHVTVESDILSGVAHLHVEAWGEDHNDDIGLPAGAQNYLISEDMAVFYPRYDAGEDRVSFRVTTRSVYETWSGMDFEIE